MKFRVFEAGDFAGVAFYFFLHQRRNGIPSRDSAIIRHTGVSVQRAHSLWRVPNSPSRCGRTAVALYC